MKTTRSYVLFVLLYLPAAVLGYLALTPEETRDFKRVENQFRVMAFRDGKPVAMTLAGLAKRAPGVTFRLPAPAVELPGGDTHKAIVLESQGDWQLVRYEYGNSFTSDSRYRAFADRVEPVSHRVTFHPGLLGAMLVLILLVGFAAHFIDRLWARLGGEK